jgi:hypothetical protein
MNYTSLLTCVRLERLPCHVRTNMTRAGTYTSMSSAKTVARMNTLLSSDSNPRESTNANHSEFIHDPLRRAGQLGVAFGDNRRRT